VFTVILMDSSGFLLMLIGLIIFSPKAEAWKMASEKMNVLRVFERKISREIYGLIRRRKLENKNE
jgi:hypothetical protein